MRRKSRDSPIRCERYEKLVVKFYNDGVVMHAGGNVQLSHPLVSLLYSAFKR